MAEKLYAVKVQRDDTVTVQSVDVVKETPQFYYIASTRGLEWNDPRRVARDAFGYSDRVPKDNAHVTARAALSRYIARRNADRANARATALQCDKQIESADRLLESLPMEDAGATPSAVGVTESA